LADCDYVFNVNRVFGDVRRQVLMLCCCLACLCGQWCGRRWWLLRKLFNNAVSI